MLKVFRFTHRDAGHTYVVVLIAPQAVPDDSNCVAANRASILRVPPKADLCLVLAVQKPASAAYCSLVEN